MAMTPAVAMQQQHQYAAMLYAQQRAASATRGGGNKADVGGEKGARAENGFRPPAPRGAANGEGGGGGEGGGAAAGHARRRAASASTSHPDESSALGPADASSYAFADPAAATAMYYYQRALAEQSGGDPNAMAMAMNRLSVAGDPSRQPPADPSDPRRQMLSLQLEQQQMLAAQMMAAQMAAAEYSHQANPGGQGFAAHPVDPRYHHHHHHHHRGAFPDPANAGDGAQTAYRGGGVTYYGANPDGYAAAAANADAYHHYGGGRGGTGEYSGVPPPHPRARGRSAREGGGAGPAGANGRGPRAPPLPRRGVGAASGAAAAGAAGYYRDGVPPGVVAGVLEGRSRRGSRARCRSRGGVLLPRGRRRSGRTGSRVRRRGSGAGGEGTPGRLGRRLGRVRPRRRPGFRRFGCTSEFSSRGVQVEQGVSSFLAVGPHGARRRVRERPARLAVHPAGARRRVR